MATTKVIAQANLSLCASFIAKNLGLRPIIVPIADWQPEISTIK
jgi:hypothetical protein